MLKAFAQRTRRALVRFGRARSGVAAIEFGLLAIPFFMLTVGLAEVGMIGLAQASLDDGISMTSRNIRVGVVQSGGLTYAQVQDQLCERFSMFIAADCEDNLFLDVDTFESFVDIDNTSPIAGGNLNTGGFGFDPGTSSSIVVVRAYYRWRILTPGFATLLQNVDGGQRILSSNIMFRNEPW
ncbi:similar to TadZ/CpaE [alpha proteobacterium U9-1i]|nr:similar to TadZ/CpaE [alpha proteobacterium U9-1i]